MIKIKKEERKMGYSDSEFSRISQSEEATIDGVTAGTVSASKAIVAGANKNVDVLAIADLKLGAGAGTSVTATATQINSLINFPGTMSTAVIDFNATGEPAMKVVINGVDYQEADVAVETITAVDIVPGKLIKELICVALAVTEVPAPAPNFKSAIESSHKWC